MKEDKKEIERKRERDKETDQATSLCTKRPLDIVCVLVLSFCISSTGVSR